MPSSYDYTLLLSSLGGLNYTCRGDTVYVIDTDGEMYPVGDVQVLARNPKARDLALNNLKKEKETKKIMDRSAIENQAGSDGAMVGEFMVALSPDSHKMPFRILVPVLTRIGEVMGYSDVRSNDAFKYGVMDKLDAYRNANTRLELAEGNK